MYLSLLTGIARLVQGSPQHRLIVLVQVDCPSCLLEPQHATGQMLEVLHTPHPARLILLGPPGSGKSTFVNHLALCLGGAWLAATIAQEQQPDGDWLEQLPGWSHTGLLPLRILLRDLAAADLVAAAERGSEALLLSFLAQQIAWFVAAWYAELAESGRQIHRGTAAGLQQVIQARSELHDLARQPLLLTMMAMVHAGKGELPAARALLYAECIDLLLRRWRKEQDGKDIVQRLGLAQFQETDLLRVMAQLGFVAHTQAERDADADQHQPADLSLGQVQEQLVQLFAPYANNDDERRDRLVSIFLRGIATRNGVLLKRSAEQGEIY